MDMQNYVGSTAVTVDFVKESPSKRLVILSAGAEKEIEGKKKIVFLVEIDGKQINWYPNKTTIRNLIETFGKESQDWIGKIVNLSVQSLNGREAIVGVGFNTIPFP